MLWNIYIARYEVSYEVPRFNHLLVTESMDTICNDYSNTNRGWRQILENVRYKIGKTLEVIPDNTNGGLCNKVYLLVSEIMDIIIKFSDTNKEYPVTQPAFDIFKSKIKTSQDKLNDFLTKHHISITYEFKIGFRGLVPFKNEEYDDSTYDGPGSDDHEGILSYLGYDRKQYAVYRLTEIRRK